MCAKIIPTLNQFVQFMFAPRCHHPQDFAYNHRFHFAIPSHHMSYRLGHLHPHPLPLNNKSQRQPIVRVMSFMCITNKDYKGTHQF
jgi:hypothetical protein